MIPEFGSIADFGVYGVDFGGFADFWGLGNVNLLCHRFLVCADFGVCVAVLGVYCADFGIHGANFW